MSGPYRIVFRGQIADGFSLESVKQSFVDRFRVGRARIDQLFSGAPVILKRDLDLDAAKRIQRAVQSVGGIVAIVGDAEAKPAPKRWSPSDQPGDPTPSPPPPVQPQVGRLEGPSPRSGFAQNAWSDAEPIALAETDSSSDATRDPSALPNVFDGDTSRFRQRQTTHRSPSPHRSAPSARVYHLGCLAVLLAAAAFFVVRHVQSRGIEHGPGVLAPSDPIQLKIGSATPFEFKGFAIIPKAEFELTARVLSVAHYRKGRESELSPIDLAMGWGRMSDESILKDIKITQSGRFYFWRVKSFPIPRKEIETHSANMHMIPADEGIAESLAQVKKGHIVSLRGKLVYVRKDDGWHWNSSLTRNDTGMGACEVIWVESIVIQ